MVSSTAAALILALGLSLGASAPTPALLAGLTEYGSKEASSSMLSTIEKEMGAKRRQAIERRAGPFEAALRATYAALPRNEYGNLGSTAAKYALHRHFVDEKGWFVKGLQELSPQGNVTDASSPVEVLQDQVPAAVKDDFRARLSSRGFGLGELAILAAALEDLVHRETLGRAAAAFKAQKLPLVGRVHADKVAAVLEHVMMSYILDNIAMQPEQREEYLQGFKPIMELYPGWSSTKKFLREVQEVVAPAERGSLTFEDLTHIIDEVNEHYGRWQDGECQALKQDLLKLEGQCPGRVPLRRFYGSALHDGMWQFSESVAYLRSMDTIDESDPGHPGVIAVNYILGPSNCIASSKYYAQCCLDACDGMISKLEKALAAPAAIPAAVEAAVVAALPPPVAPWDVLRLRLREIARANGGAVPLHNRLFAQWLHHAFPRECPVPAAAGAEQHQELPEAFTARTGLQNYAANLDMKAYIKTSTEDLRTKCTLPWTPGEVPLVPASERLEQAAAWPSLPSSIPAGAAAAVLLAAAAVATLVVRQKAKRGGARGPLLVTEA